ncbi:MAG: domain containing protein [Ferruginibacter sp.]|nr:domain containing protein [Ferruginibacter sp.]
MRKVVLLTLSCTCIFFSNVYPQGCPPNIDFETGKFDHWDCFVGTTSANGIQNTITLLPSLPLPNRHELISGNSPQLMDPYGNFPQLCPYGGNYSVKLGNNNIGKEAEGISYTFKIPAVEDTFSFTYFYAVVFEDPSHSAIEQPRFFVTAYDVATGKLINCASYNYIANGAIPGFQVSPNHPGVLYRNWSPVSIQFAGLGNHTVRLEFKTADCTQGGHFGYAYLDVGTGCSNILATAPYCIETNSLILNAPYGFQAYTWYNENYTAVIGNQQSVVLSPPPATSGIFHVDIDPYPGYGCRDTVSAIVLPLSVPDTPAASVYTFCQFQSVMPLTAVTSPRCDLIWYSVASGGIGSHQAPVPATSVPGIFNYYVSQKLLFGCESLRKKITVTVVPMPAASFIINNTRQCQQGNLFIFTSTSGNLQNAVLTWNFGDGQSMDSASASVNHIYTTPGTFTVKLRAANTLSCFTEKQFQVTVVPKPLADFNFPSLVCEGQTPVIINNTSTTGGLSTLNSWWWNINGSIYSLQTPQPFIANTPGQYPVKLVVRTAEGCGSDTAVKMIPVRYRPAAPFTFSQLLCENEIVQFNNGSLLPAAAQPEFIKNWYWQFDNSISNTGKNPAEYFSTGMHQASLIAETNYGCKSLTVANSFLINPKPHVRLNITDSCAMRTITYQASEITGMTIKSFWNFGDGVSQLPNMIYKQFDTEGSHVLTLVNESIHGCRDTVVRPFTIFENKASAGRDTITAMDEPVQLNAHGDPDCKYLWSPASGLNNSTIENPVAILQNDQLYHLDAITKEGCDSHTKILIRRYKGPALYIPTAFTPNGDGKNDLLKVFPVGIRSFAYFAVFNRFGQQLFFTKDYGKGWDGCFRGNKQDPGAYIAIASAVDYKGSIIVQKLSVLLLR